MLKINRKCPASMRVTGYPLCSFSIFWRNPKVDRRPRPDDCHADPEDRRIDIMPSVFHDMATNGTLETYSYNILGVSVKSFTKALIDDGFQICQDDRIFYCHGDNNDEIQIETDSDLYDALIYAKDSKPRSVKIIIEGEFVMTKSGLKNMSIPAQPLSTTTTSDNNSECIKKYDVDMHWLKNYMENYKKEIIEDLSNKIATIPGRKTTINPSDVKLTSPIINVPHVVESMGNRHAPFYQHNSYYSTPPPATSRTNWIEPRPFASQNPIQVTQSSVRPSNPKLNIRKAVTGKSNGIEDSVLLEAGKSEKDNHFLITHVAGNVTATYKCDSMEELEKILPAKSGKKSKEVCENEKQTTSVNDDKPNLVCCENVVANIPIISDTPMVDSNKNSKSSLLEDDSFEIIPGQIDVLGERVIASNKPQAHEEVSNEVLSTLPSKNTATVEVPDKRRDGAISIAKQKIWSAELLPDMKFTISNN